MMDLPVLTAPRTVGGCRCNESTRARLRLPRQGRTGIFPVGYGGRLRSDAVWHGEYVGFEALHQAFHSEVALACFGAGRTPSFRYAWARCDSTVRVETNICAASSEAVMVSSES